jgi:hypothetical protein
MRFIGSPLHQEETQHTDERDQRDLPCTGVSRDKPRRIARFALTKREGVFFDIGTLSARQ